MTIENIRVDLHQRQRNELPDDIEADRKDMREEVESRDEYDDRLQEPDKENE
jgi:hypothetical protein